MGSLRGKGRVEESEVKPIRWCVWGCGLWNTFDESLTVYLNTHVRFSPRSRTVGGWGRRSGPWSGGHAGTSVTTPDIHYTEGLDQQLREGRICQ